MKCTKTESTITKYTVELTKEELISLVAGIGDSSESSRADFIKRVYGVDLKVESNFGITLYKELRDTAGLKKI